MIDLIKTYNKEVKIPLKKYNPNSKEGFTPSSLGGKCLRKIYYKYSKSPEECGFTLKSSRIVALGNEVGDHLAAKFRKSGILVDYYNPDGSVPISFGKENREFPIRAEELGIRYGFIDGVFVDGGILSLGEFKSINKGGYDPLIRPKNDHLFQGVIYLHIFNKMLKDGKFNHIRELDGHLRAEGITFLYYNKNNSQLKQFHITLTGDIFKQIVERIFYIQGVGETQKLPPATENFCNSCPYEKRCQAGEMSPRHGGLVLMK